MKWGSIDRMRSIIDFFMEISSNQHDHWGCFYSNSPTVNSRFSTSGAPSMPPTPSGTRLPLATTSVTVPLSCPDGLAHALSEQNLRLQQIVHEAKVK